jgi:hypothetical protein
MPLRLDNAKGVAHMPTAGAAKNKSFEPRFKIDHAASPMPETRQPERLAPRATSNRKGGRDHLGILGEIKSVHPGEIIRIRIISPSIGAQDNAVTAAVVGAEDDHAADTHLAHLAERDLERGRPSEWVACGGGWIQACRIKAVVSTSQVIDSS